MAYDSAAADRAFQEAYHGVGVGGGGGGGVSHVYVLTPDADGWIRDIPFGSHLIALRGGAA